MNLSEFRAVLSKPDLWSGNTNDLGGMEVRFHSEGEYNMTVLSVYVSDGQLNIDVGPALSEEE
jgi:hypothetical protein